MKPLSIRHGKPRTAARPSSMMLLYRRHRVHRIWDIVCLHCSFRGEEDGIYHRATPAGYPPRDHMAFPTPTDEQVRGKERCAAMRCLNQDKHDIAEGLTVPPGTYGLDCEPLPERTPIRATYATGRPRSTT